jgi:hypothetical protein
VTTLLDRTDRKYAIVYYYCQKRAGSLLHGMFITVTLAMIHNRTILLKYDTDFPPNTEQDCNQVLEHFATAAVLDNNMISVRLDRSDDCHRRSGKK